MFGVFVTNPMLVFRNMDIYNYNLSLLRIYEPNVGKPVLNDDIILNINKSEKYNPKNIIKKFDKFILIYEFTIKRKNSDIEVEYYFNGDRTLNKFKFIVPGINTNIKLFYYPGNVNIKNNNDIWKNFYKTHISDNKDDNYKKKTKLNFNISEPFYEKKYNTNEDFSDCETDDSIENEKNNICNKFHIMLCGGNHIFSDDVLKLNYVINYEIYEYEEINSKLEKYYFDLYMNYLKTPYLSDLSSSIPKISILGNHDIYDCLGSYDNKFSSLKIIENIKNIGYHYYLLFQHNINNIDNSNNEKIDYDYFGNIGYNKIYKLDNLAVISLDIYSERTCTTIFDKKTFIILKEKINEISGKFKHYIFMIGNPLIYPYNSEFTKYLLEKKNNKYLQHPFKLITKMNKFDSLYESLNCIYHLNEKEEFINLILLLNNNNPNIMILSEDPYYAGISQYKYTKLNLKIKQIVISSFGNKNECLSNEIINKNIKLCNNKIENENNNKERVIEYINIKNNLLLNDCLCFLSFNNNMFHGSIYSHNNYVCALNNDLFEKSKFNFCCCF
jgi:hypothetical protein